MRIRLRPAYPDDVLADIYAMPYDHTRWQEHRDRVTWTADRINHLIALTRPQICSVVDLSCGDGALLDMITGVDVKGYSDIVQPNITGASVGPIERTVKTTKADMLLCSETLEHLDDPDVVLRDAMQNFEWIVITTPLGEDDPDKNYEHYWGWDMIGIGNMLYDTGWKAQSFETLNLPFYTYQLWTARRKS